MVSEVVQVGKHVKDIHIGDRVYPYPLLAMTDSRHVWIETLNTHEYPWEQLPQAIEKASRVDEAFNVVIRY